MDRVVTTFVNPPIPNRDFDWAASFDGYEPGDAVGHGPTPEAAINDLIEQTNE